MGLGQLLISFNNPRNVGALLVADGAHNPARKAHDDGTVRHTGPGRDNGTRGNEAVRADFTVVQNGGTNPNERSGPHRLAMDDRMVAYGNIVRNLERDATAAVENRAILDIHTCPEPDGCHVSTKHTVVPNVALCTQNHIPFDHRRRRDVNLANSLHIVPQVLQPLSRPGFSARPDRDRVVL